MAETSPRLTVVLPLKGRPLFTLRFLWHANRAKLPYRFILADGEAREPLATLLDDARSMFADLDITYVRYPDDVNFGAYYRKLADAVGRVTTPYVVMADNDDFLAQHGLERSLDFLDANPDYGSCGGGLAGFSVYPYGAESYDCVRGPLNKLAYRYMPDDRPIDLHSPSMTRRLVDGLSNSWSYYAVFRTPGLAAIHREVAEMDLSNLQFQEKYCAMRTMTLGKSKNDAATISYFRQYWTSMRSAFASKDWVHHLLRNNFTNDFHEIVSRIATRAAEADGTDKQDVSERLREAFEPWLRGFLRRNFGASAVVRKYIRDRAPGLLIWLKHRRRLSARFEEQALVSRLRRAGASESDIEGFKLDLARIRQTIDGPEFADFLRPLAQKIGAATPGLR